MNLKEAFQAQNKLEELFEFVHDYLQSKNNLTSVKEKHLRSKAAEGQPDEEIELNTDKLPPDKVIDFMLKLIVEREELAEAIDEAKDKISFSIDSAVDVNKKRHLTLSTLRSLRQVKSSSELLKNSGSGFIFNKEGNQTTYRYDVERITTIDFDRNRVRELIKKLQAAADEVSNEIDAALVNTEVDYNLPFDPHATSLEILEEFS